MIITADNLFVLYLNGQAVGESGGGTQIGRKGHALQGCYFPQCDAASQETASWALKGKAINLEQRNAKPIGVALAAFATSLRFG